MVFSMGVVPEVPAWKRLGLQLKCAQNVVGAGLRQDISPSKSKKRKRHVDDVSHRDSGVHPEPFIEQAGTTTSTTQPKKRKKHVPPTPTQDPRKHPEPSIKQPGISTAQSHLTEPNLKRTKSVAFTQDTKTTDGDSIKQLFQAWVKEQRAQDPSFRPEKAGDAFKIKNITSETTKDSPPKQRKTAAKRNKSSHPQPSTANDKTKDSHLHPALVYLLQHYHSPQDWKFNKARQLYLLRHVLDLERIPPKYTKPLCLYLGGLRGQGVRDRLKAKMEQVTNKDPSEEKTAPQEPEPEWEKQEPKEDDDATAKFLEDIMGPEAGLLDIPDSELILPNGNMEENEERRRRARTILMMLSMGQDVGHILAKKASIDEDGKSSEESTKQTPETKAKAQRKKRKTAGEKSVESTLVKRARGEFAGEQEIPVPEHSKNTNSEKGAKTQVGVQAEPKKVTKTQVTVEVKSKKGKEAPVRAERESKSTKKTSAQTAAEPRTPTRPERKRKRKLRTNAVDSDTSSDSSSGSEDSSRPQKNSKKKPININSSSDSDDPFVEKKLPLGHQIEIPLEDEETGHGSDKTMTAESSDGVEITKVVKKKPESTSTTAKASAAAGKRSGASGLGSNEKEDDPEEYDSSDETDYWGLGDNKKEDQSDGTPSPKTPTAAELTAHWEFSYRR